MTHPSLLDRQRGAAPIAIVVVAAAVALALVVTVSALASYKTSTAQKGWDEVLGSWDELMQRYPATEANRSALELERLAASLGIDIVPRAAERRDEILEQLPVEHFGEFHAANSLYMKSQMERVRSGELDAPPAEVLTYITSHADDLIALRRHLVQSDVPVWHSDLSRGAAAPLPNLLGHIKLQKLLAGVALTRLHAGDTSGALEDVEAAWKLSGSLHDSPFLIGQLIRFAGSRMQLGVLRHVPDIDGRWIDRLSENDFRESFITAMKLEGWSWLHYSDSEVWLGERPAWERVAAPLTEPYTRLCLADLSDSWREALLRLEQVDALCDRDLAPLAADMDFELPRWNVVAEQFYPNLLGAIGRLARLELELELTQLLIEADGERRANGGRWPDGFATERASVACPDDRWNYSVNGAELTIALSRDVRWPEHKGTILPTTAVLP